MNKMENYFIKTLLVGITRISLVVKWFNFVHNITVQYSSDKLLETLCEEVIFLALSVSLTEGKSLTNVAVMGLGGVVSSNPK